MRLRIGNSAALPLAWLLVSSFAGAQSPPNVSHLLMSTGPVGGIVDSRLAATRGEVQIVVRMRAAPLAVMVGGNARRLGSRLTPDQQRAYLEQLRQSQDALMAQIRGLGGRELARVSKTHNAVIVAVDASRVAAVAALPGVATIRPVVHYQQSLSTTLPYTGAAAVQALGVNGAGIKVAVLDSGIDYTHRNLGGAGTTAAYLAAYGADPSSPLNKTTDGLVPTAKVVGGYDFVGEQWPNAARAPDPDPIDFEGHGTHVADIIAGLSTDGTHKGVAPGATLLAVKTCSAVSTSCNGIALLQGMDFSVDPNGDGDISDAADVINMSLGLAYGQREDDLSEASANVGGAVAGRVDVFSLTGVSPQFSSSVLPRPGDNFAIVDFKAVGARQVNAGGSPAVQFAINTWGRRSHPNYPAEFDVFIDASRDGTDDYVIFNAENGGFEVTGQNVVAVLNLATNATVVRFFSDAGREADAVTITP